MCSGNAQYVNIHSHRLDTDADICIYNCNNQQEVITYTPYCSFGLHPWDVLSTTQTDEFCEILQAVLQNKQIVCVGECGLDRSVNVDFTLQIDACRRQLLLAQQFQVPVIIHCVRAYSDIISLYKQLRLTIPLIFHKFSGNSQIVNQLLQYPMYMSVGGELLTQRDTSYFNYIPLERLFLETDAGALSIRNVYQRISELRQVEIDVIVRQVCNNYRTVLGG